MGLDIQTIIFMIFIVNVINAGTIAVIWRHYRKRFAGLSYWLADMACQALGAALLVSRNVIPGLFSVVLANALLIGGGALLVTGVDRFAGGKRLFPHNYALTFVFAAFIAYFYAIKPDLAVRKIAMSAMVVFLFLQIAFILARKTTKPGIRHAARGVIYATSGGAAFNLVRIAMVAASPDTSGDLFKSGFADVMALTLFLTLNICLMVALVLAVTRRLLGEVQAQEDKFAKAFRSAPYAVILSRLSDGLILEVNDQFVDNTGYGYEEVRGKTTLELGMWEKDEDRLALTDGIAAHGRVADTEARFRKKSGELLVGRFSAELLEIDGERCVLTSIRDTTEEAVMRRRLEEMATHDALTGLPNRRLLDDRFVLAAANAGRAKKNVAVLSLDLDRFKNINDTYGHAVGDSVLVEAAVRLRASLRKGDTVARIGGDEFVVLLSDIEKLDFAVEVAGKILSEFRKPFRIEGHVFELSVSVGISLYPENGSILEDLLRKSDKAMYGVKERGRNGYRTA